MREQKTDTFTYKSVSISFVLGEVTIVSPSDGFCEDGTYVDDLQF